MGAFMIEYRDIFTIFSPTTIAPNSAAFIFVRIFPLFRDNPDNNSPGEAIYLPFFFS